jgi:hypothetical protein
MKDKIQAGFMTAFIACLVGWMMYAGGPAYADSTSNVKVGIKQGGKELYVKSGGQIKVRDLSFHKVAIRVISTGEVTGINYAHAPHAGTVSQIVCSNTAAPNSTVVLTSRINGTAITNGSVTYSSGAAAWTEATATPTAANTVANYDVLSMESDGGGSAAGDAICTLFITP